MISGRCHVRFRIARSVRIGLSSLAILSQFASATDSGFPKPLRGWIYRTCGGGYASKVVFDRPFAIATTDTELVSGGSFESPVVSVAQGYDGVTLNGWKVRDIDLVNTGYLSSSLGQQSLDINGSSSGEITQTLPSTNGADIALSFDWSVNTAQKSPEVIQAVVAWNGQVIDTVTGSGSQPHAWKSYTRTLKAIGSDVLSFRSITPGLCGIMLDNVSARQAKAVNRVVISTDTVRLWNGSSAPIVRAAADPMNHLDSTRTVLTLALPSLPENPSRTGVMDLVLNSSDSTARIQVGLSDSIGPWLDSIKIAPVSLKLARDTMYFWTSEPVRFTDRSWFLSVTRNGAPIALGSDPQDSVRSVDPAMNGYALLIPAGVMLPGDRATLVKGSDSVGALASNCPEFSRRVGWEGAMTEKLAPPEHAWYLDTDGDGTIDRVELVFAKRLPIPVDYRFFWPNSMGKMVRVAVKGRPEDLDSDTVGVSIAGFDSLVTGQIGPMGGFGLMIDPVTGDSSYFTVADHAPPALVKAVLRFDPDKDGVDTLVLRFSEVVGISNGGLTTAGNVAVKAMLGNLIRFRGYEQDPNDPAVVRLFLDSSSTGFQLGDTLAAAGHEGSLEDLLHNQAGPHRRWVKLEFGPRAPVYKLENKHPILVMPGIGNDALGTSLMVLTRGADGNWSDLNGSNAIETQDELLSGGAGIEVTINHEISGQVYIYDKMGVSLAFMDLSSVKAAWSEGRIPVDSRGFAKLWLRWNGCSTAGEAAVTGVYAMRVVVVSNPQDPGRTKLYGICNKVFNLGLKRE
jgi:Protein of unknown function (DUF642)